MKDFKELFNKKKVVIFGHTGFKGSWLTLWLVSLGAKVIGVSKNIPTKPSNFIACNLKKKVKNIFLNIKDFKKIKNIIFKYKPDYVFHLAAQSLVRKSYTDPLDTWQTNLLGTVNILESLKYLKNKCTVVIVTSDKSYKNIEVKRGYKESDLLGGADPYSASKGATEFAIQSYIKSYFNNKNNKIFIAVGRAGNVIGGGDWSADRLVPDCIKCWSKNKTVVIRNHNSTRPWQHVLEAISGYLTLASLLRKNKKLHGEVFNFGPSNKNNFRVLDLIKNFKKKWSSVKWKLNKNKFFKEANLLKLNSNKAKTKLKWKSVLSFNEIINFTIEWYKSYYFKNKNMKNYSLEQINKFNKIFRNRLIK